MRRMLMATACAALTLSGCLTSTTHVEPVRDAHVRFEMGPAQPHLRMTEVSFREDPQGLSLLVHRQEMCAVKEVRRSQDEVHTKTEASPRRWIPAAVVGAFAAAQIVDYQQSDEEDRDRSSLIVGTSLLAGLMAGLVMVPTAMEGERTHLGDVHERTVPAPERPCGQGPVAAARVSVRTDGETLEGRTSYDGFVRFEGIQKAHVRAVFVEGVAAWTRGTAP